MDGNTIVPPLQDPLGTVRDSEATSAAAGTAASLVCTSTRVTSLKAGSALTRLPSGRVRTPFPLALPATKSPHETELSVKPFKTVVRIRLGSKMELPPSPCGPTDSAVSTGPGIPGGDSVHRAA